MTPGIRPLVAGNWKMNGTSASLNELRAIGHGFMTGLDAETDALICPPATLLAHACEVLKTTPVKVGGQDCHPRESGAHTGDISAEMLKDSGASHVIVGHSERRADHGETVVPPAVTTELPPKPVTIEPEMPHTAKLTTSSTRSSLATQVPAAFLSAESMNSPGLAPPTGSAFSRNEAQ